MTPEVSVVIPAYNGGRHLGQVLTALHRADGDTPVVVVDAGSTDDTPEVAVAHGAHVIRLGQRAGPAQARNVGAAEVSADIVLFLDADCVPHSDVIERVRQAFGDDPELVSITGSYDADPPEPNFFSKYMNLRHRFFHQNARREDATFWAGCGAVRRETFLEVGGFDALRFPSPQIEDIELGNRLRRIGRMRLDPDLQVTHLKRWNLRSVVETDILSRALPWGRLILETGEVPDDLNLGWPQRIAAGIAPVALLSLIAAPWAAWTGRWIPLGAASVVIAASGVLHAGMFRHFASLHGVGFAVAACLFHQVHLVYSSATMAFCMLERLARRRLP
jgi:hypothetical protein